MVQPCDEHEQYAVWIDGKLVVTNSAVLFPKGRTGCPTGFDFTFPDTAEHDLRVEY